MLRRSASADVVPWAQQLPQYVGMCWLRLKERKFVSLTLLHVKVCGRSEGDRYVCGSGDVTRSDSGRSNVVRAVLTRFD